MLLQITAKPDARLIATAIRRSLRPHLMLARVAGWVAIGLALLIEVFTSAGLSPSLLLIGVALAVGVPMLLINNGTRRAMREARLTTYEISESGVASSNLDSRHAYAWNSFTYVEELPGQLLFGNGTTWFLPVPTTDLDLFQIDQVMATAITHGLEIRRAPGRQLRAV